MAAKASVCSPLAVPAIEQANHATGRAARPKRYAKHRRKNTSRYMPNQDSRDDGRKGGRLLTADARRIDAGDTRTKHHTTQEHEP